jgi:hypothetical protein
VSPPCPSCPSLSRRCASSPRFSLWFSTVLEQHTHLQFNQSRTCT